MRKIHSLLLCLAIFFLPTQFGKHFWPDSSFIGGLRVDYLSPTLYFTDFLIVFLFFSTLLLDRGKTSIKTMLGFTPLALVIFTAGRADLSSWFKVWKIVEISMFTLALIQSWPTAEFRFWAKIGLLNALVFQSGLAVAQVFNHGSLQGFFYYFGERQFSASTLGVATASINGQLILRPYGTFSHPNVLAGFLLMGFIILSSLKICRQLKIPVLILIFAALLTTFSRTAILVFLIFAGFKLFWKKITAFCLVFLLVIFFTKGRFLSLLTEDQFSWNQRLKQTKIAVSMIKDNWVCGVGLNHYLKKLPRYEKKLNYEAIQPVHNFWLLVFCETGVVGIAVCLFYLIKNFNFNWLFFAFIFLSFFDHYFYTSQQGILLLGLTLSNKFWKNYN